LLWRDLRVHGARCRIMRSPAIRKTLMAEDVSGAFGPARRQHNSLEANANEEFLGAVVVWCGR